MRRSPFSLLCLPLLAFFLSACAPPSGGGGGEGGKDAGPKDSNTCLIDGVEVVRPAEPATRKDGAPPVLDCLETPPELGPSRTVTVEGCIDIFGIGNKAKPTLRVAFYDIDQNPRDDTPSYGDVAIAVKSQEGPLQNRAAECETEGFYQLAGVPTNQRLIVKVYDSEVGPSQTAIPTYTYYALLPDERVDDNGVVEYAANLVYKTTYDSIPTLGGKRVEGQQIVYDGVGRGVIAGEIRDCEGQVLKNAAVSSSRLDSGTKIAYFDGSDDPKPDLTRDTTNSDGLYVVLNVATDDGANDHTVAAGILDESCEGEECTCQSLGSATVYAFPDSVTILSLEGDLSVGR